MDSQERFWTEQHPGCSQEDRPRLENLLCNRNADVENSTRESMALQSTINDEPNTVRLGRALGYRDGNSDQESVRSNVTQNFTKSLPPLIFPVQSSTTLREVHSAAELPIRRLNLSSKLYLKSISRNRSIGIQSSMDQSLYGGGEVAASVNNCYQEFGDKKMYDIFVCSLYITSYNIIEDNVNMKINAEPFVETLKNVTKGRVRLQKTACGLIVAFTSEMDADKVMRMPLQEIFQGPIQVVRFQTGEYKFTTNVIIKDVPWCISNLDIRQALGLQGIRIGKIRRSMNTFKVEVLNSLHTHKLIEEGLNFFDHTSFPAQLENTPNQGPPEIVQCFKCQGFWHTSNRCRQVARCVRCGSHHDVEYCPRPRNSPICCHCGGAHHAAYKMCPVRLQHVHAVYIGFHLAKSKPSRAVPQNIVF